MQLTQSMATMPARRALADLASNGVSVVARLSAGVVLFVAVGRFLGPQGFGEFVFSMAVGSLLAFFCGLGFNQQVLREVAANPAKAQDIADALASARLLLSLCVFAASAVVAASIGGLGWVVCLFTLALMCDGAVEFLFALMKAKGRYEIEARFATLSSLGHFAFVGLVAYFSRNLLSIAAAFCFSRMVQLLMATIVLRTRLALPRLNSKAAVVASEIRAGWAYAFDAGLQVAASQLDTILVRMLLGAPAAGIYQAGMRVVVGFQNFSVVAGNVFVPRLTRSAQDRDAWQAVCRQSQRLYLVLACAGGLAVWALGWFVTRYGYGVEFASLQDLWPWLAALMALRMLGASYGIQLTALGAQSFRSLVNLAMLLGIVVLILAAAHLGWGVMGVVAAMCVGSLFVLWAYRMRARRLGETR